MENKTIEQLAEDHTTGIRVHLHDVLDAHLVYDAFIAGAKAMTRWIPIEEGLPKDKAVVQFKVLNVKRIYHGKFYKVDNLNVQDIFHSFEGDACYPCESVSHYRYIDQSLPTDK